MRVLVLLTLFVAGATALAATQREVQRAARDDQLLANAGVEPSQAQLRLPCSAAVVQSDDRPDFFDCVYVQTNHDLNLFTLENGFLMSELQLTLANMDGVALQRMGRYAQVQIFSGDRVAALYIHDASWLDPRQTEAVYEWLVNHGVAPKAPRKWIGP